MPKAPKLEAVREAKGEGTAQLGDPFKKGEMATEAERLPNGSGWLPYVLRRHDLDALDGMEGQGRLNSFPTPSRQKTLTCKPSLPLTRQAIRHNGDSEDYNPAALVRFTRNLSRRRW